MGRNTRGGRNWEGFSPDPYLTGKLFADSIRGIQSTGVQACAKHFVGNEQGELADGSSRHASLDAYTRATRALQTNTRGQRLWFQHHTTWFFEHG